MHIEEAKALLREAEHVAMTEQQDGLDVRIRAKADTTVSAMAVLFVAAALCLAGAWVLYRYSGMRYAPLMLAATGAGVIMVGLIVLLARIANGGPKDQCIAMRSGSISVDRYLAGDHIVKSYSVKQVRGVFAEAGFVFLATTVGEIQIVAFLSKDAGEAVATLAAAHLWPDQSTEVVMQTVGYGLHRTSIAPAGPQ